MSTVDDFHQLWWDKKLPWTTTWKGTQLVKNPLDLWVYSEIIYQTKPNFIIETGTHLGGSAQFLADMMQTLNGGGKVITIDVQAMRTITDKNIIQVIGDSKTVDIPRTTGKVMVILDSDHSAPHVLAELERFGPMVSRGCYLIVEDSNVGGHPVESDYATGGPMAAIDQWLPNHSEFTLDPNQERYLLTMNPRGYLRRN